MHRRLRQRIQRRKWFYRFDLPDGTRTESYLPPEVLPLHETRALMLEAHLSRHFGSSWEGLRCLDLACHEGYFSMLLAKGGCRDVVGIDARREHIEHAGLIRQALRLANLDLRCCDLLGLDPAALGRFHVVLLFGALYHLGEPLRALALVRALTSKVCLIETQLAPELDEALEWGSCGYEMPIRGCLAIVDESQEIARGNREAGIAPTSLVPSRDGLLWLLRAAGFTNIEVLTPPPGAHEQLARGRRVMVAASVD